MRPSTMFGAVLVIAAALPVAAQAPRITAAGDPSIRNDSIYALVVDPATHPEEDYVLLLDDGVVRVEADGRTTRTYRQVVQLLTDDAVETFSERVFGWAPETERFRLNWIRVVKPDGTVISDRPAQQQEADVPIPVDNPVYAARKQLRITMSGVAKGTIVDWSTTTEDTKVWLAGDFLTSWSVHTAVPVRRSRWILDHPAGMRVHLQERNLTFPPRRVTRGGRTTVTYTADDVPRLKAQLFAADSGARWMSIAVTGPVTWARIGTWYQGLAASRTVLGAAAAAAVHDQVGKARTLRDSILAVHRWVAQDIRYVSVALGDGGYQPRAPEDVVRSGYGDCKDKATLFVAAMRAFGVPARTILLGSAGRSDPGLPAIAQFNHAIARVDLPDGPVYTDLTAGMVPFGELPPSLDGQLGVAVDVTGVPDTVRLPLMDIEHNRSASVLRGTIDTLGRIRGESSLERSGAMAMEMRGNYAVQLDSTERDRLGRSVVQSMFPGAICDSMVLFDGNDLQAPVRVWFSYHDGRALRRSGRNWILPNPLGTMEQLDASADAIEREGERWEAIDLAAANGLSVLDVTAELRLPAGWRPVLPPDVHVASDVGRYDVTYAFIDGVFRARRVMHGARGILPPSRIDEIVGYFRELASDNTPLITLETTGR